MSRAKVSIVAALVWAAAAVGVGAPGAVKLLAAETPESAAAGLVPTAEVVQLLYSFAGDYGEPRKSDMPKDIGDFRPCSMVALGDCLYTGNFKDKGNAVHCFKRDAKTGMLSFGNVVTSPGKEHSIYVFAAGGRLYAIRTRAELFANVGNQLAWYDIDARTGKPVERGAVPVAKNSGPGQADPAKTGWVEGGVVSKDQKNVYFIADGSALLWYRLGADGAPIKAGELACKASETATLVIAPDGNHLYNMSRQSITCLEIGPTGQPAVKSVTDLDPKWNVKDKVVRLSLSLTPDGKWLYANFCLGQPDAAGRFVCGVDAWLAIYRRDPASGALALQEAGSGRDSTRPDFKLANGTGLKLVFMPDGLGGFAATAGPLLRSFRRDPDTGRLSDVAEFPEWDKRVLGVDGNLWLDGQNGFLYGLYAAGDGPIHTMGAPEHPLWVAKVGQGPVRPQVKATLTGNARPSGAAAAADWPCWRGPTHDQRSPLKGIRKDWTGGLRKVWEVEGLSPGQHSWSTPAIQGDKLVVTGLHGSIYEAFCFDADKGGQPLWTAEFGGIMGGHFGWGSGAQSTPAISGDKVYCVDNRGLLSCIRMADGKMLWKQFVSGGEIYGSSPLICGDLVIAPGTEYWHSKYLYAYQKDTGQLAWSYGGGGANTCATPTLATIDGKEQIVATQARSVFGVDPTTGKEVWKYSNSVSFGDGGPISSPVIWGNNVWTGWVTGSVRIGGGVAKPIAGYETGSLNTPIVLRDYMYAFKRHASSLQGGSDGSLVCVNAATGEVKWKEKIGEGSMAVVDGCLLCLTYGGDLLLVEPHPEGFKKLAEMKKAISPEAWENHRAERLNDPPRFKEAVGGFGVAPCWTAPAVARGKVYIRYSDRLACYDLMEAGSRESAAAQNPDTGEAGNSQAKPRIATDRPPASANRYLPSKAPKPASTAGAGTAKAPATRTVSTAAAERPGWTKNWPQFRGPWGDGRAADDAAPPAKLDLAKDTRFSTALPARGRSSPIVWGNRIYLTGEDACVMAFDRETGKLQWNTTLKVPGATGKPDRDEPGPAPLGGSAGGAAATPVTDGQFVYACFGNGILGCVDSGGKQIWARALAASRPKNMYGLAASPVLYGDLLIQVVDRGQSARAKVSFVVAVRAKDGAEVWRKERPVSSCWTTPAIIRGSAGDVLLTTAPRLVIAYDPQTGQERWQAEGATNPELSASTLPCGEGVVLLAGGEGLTALKVGGQGNMTKSALVWTSDIAPPQVASPAGGDGRCYLLGSGDLTCVDTASGKEKWNLELDGDFWASPVLAKDRVYAINRKGRLFVVSTAGQKLDEIQLDAGVDATPAIVEGRIYIRTGTGLLCLGRP